MYSSKSSEELKELLRDFASLTFESQLELNKELDKRNIHVAKTDLEQAIATRLYEIKQLKYLKDLGFKAHFVDNQLVIKRTSKAKSRDIMGVIAGFILFFIGVYGVASLISILVNGEDVNVFKLGFNLGIASLVLVGFRLFSGLNRLFEYDGFSLYGANGLVHMKKRFDMQLEEVKALASELFIDANEDKLTLKLKDYPIFDSDADDLTQKLTMEALVDQFQAS